MISELRGVRILRGKAPDRWSPAIWRLPAASVVIGPLSYLAALTTRPAPETLFDFSLAPVAAAIGWTAVLGIALYHLVVTALALTGRASGAALAIIGFGCVTTIISALAIAAVPLGSPSLVTITVLLIAWSIWRVRRTIAKVPDRWLPAIAEERFSLEDGEVILIPATAREEKGSVDIALDGTGGGCLSVLLEFGGLLVVIAAGPILLPLTITGQFDGGIALPLAIWFIQMAILLGMRRPVCVWILLARAAPLARTRLSAPAG